MSRKRCAARRPQSCDVRTTEVVRGVTLNLYADLDQTKPSNQQLDATHVGPYTVSTEGHGGPRRKALIHFALRVLPGVLVVPTPVARCDHRNHEAPAVADQFLISVRVEL